MKISRFPCFRDLALACAISCIVFPGCGDSAGGSDDGDQAPSCDQNTFSSAPGFEECFACQEESCCAELQGCADDDVEGCAYCAGAPTDTACVDSNTFTYFPLHQALLDCATSNCDLLCQGKDPSDCVPGDCEPSCANYGNGCN